MPSPTLHCTQGFYLLYILSSVINCLADDEATVVLALVHGGDGDGTGGPDAGRGHTGIRHHQITSFKV